jgi:hypothetical protein
MAHDIVDTLDWSISSSRLTRPNSPSHRWPPPASATGSQSSSFVLRRADDFRFRPAAAIASIDSFKVADLMVCACSRQTYVSDEQIGSDTIDRCNQIDALMDGLRQRTGSFRRRIECRPQAG